MPKLKKFSESILYRFPHSLKQRILFHLLGFDFIGAEIRLAHLKKALKRVPPFFHALDAGCGTGDFSFYLAERYPHCSFSAYDINEKTLMINKEIQIKMGINNISFCYKDLLKLKEREMYDFIFSIGTLIYFSKEETKKILANLTNALQKNGYLYLDIPQEDFLEVTFIHPNFYRTYYNALKKENSGNLCTQHEILSLLEELGYKITYTTKSFSFPGKLAWELDNFLREKKFNRTRIFLLPLLKGLSRADAMGKHKKGCCFVILAEKR